MPILVVTIDTEEEGRWSTTYPTSGNTCRNVARLGRLHAVIRRTGAVPTYMVDYPVASDPEARDILSGFAAGGGAEIGAHLHPWCNPPYDDSPVTPARTYPHNLPPDVQLSKLRLLCDRIQEGVGTRPTSYRAGRWGFDRTSVPVLERMGIQVDTSVRPLWWDRADGGPDFLQAPLRPYRLNPADACKPGDSSVVEVPASAMVVGGHGRAVERVLQITGPLPLPGLGRMLAGLGLRSLSPERHDLDAMRSLADGMRHRGLPVFNVTFHSTAALPGATPYVSTEEDLDEFCRRVEGILQHILAMPGVTPLPLSRVPAAMGDSILAAPAR